MHFSTGRQIFNIGGLIFYSLSTGTKACVTAADLIDSDENLHCLKTCITLPLNSCNIDIAVVSQCRSTASEGFSRLFNIRTQLLMFFFTDWQLALARLLSDLVTVDKDWHRLNLLTGSQCTSPETQTQIWNWLRQLPHHIQVIHCLQTVHFGLPLMSQWWQNTENSCILSSRLMKTPCTRNAA